MNKNKGIISLGLIMIIVLGIAVVGGGAYYLGRNGFKQEVKNLENILPNPENKNIDCDLNTTPSIKVLSPNGGEIFTLGQTINIKWISKCINSSALVYLSIGIKDSQAVPELLDNMRVSNTGSYNFIIPTNYNLNGYISNKYQVAISYIYGNGDSVNGHSDNSFTINYKVSTTNWKTYANVKHGFSFKYPDTWSQWGNESEAVCDLNTGATCVTMVDFMDTVSQGIESYDGNNNEVYAPKDHLHIEYHFDSNGSELYQYATSQFEAKQGLYVINSKKIEVAGKTAIVSDIVSSINGKGKPMIPLRFISIQFLDKNNIGEFDFQFSTPKTNDSTEVSNFEKILTTFKFNN